MGIALPPADWIRVTPCERGSLTMLRRCLMDREEEGGRHAVEGLGLFSLRRAGACEAYLSPAAAAALCTRLEGLVTRPSRPPPDDPTLKLEVGDAELWKTVVRRPGGAFLAA